MRKTALVTAAVMLVLAVFSPALAEEARADGTVAFGSWPQGKGGEVLPIEWTVLDVDEDGYSVLLSVRALAEKPYNDDYAAVTWEDCSLRAWLNGEFYDTAFSAGEQALIKLSEIENGDNFHYGTPGGGDTADRVYLLSLDEAAEYFDIAPEDFDRPHDGLLCAPTEYALASGAKAFVHTETEFTGHNKKYDGCCRWWLRSPGYEPKSASYVYFFGDVCFGGYLVDSARFGVRPVIRVKID